MTTASNTTTRPALLALLAGFTVSTLVSLLASVDTAWSSPFYFIIGIPLLCVAVGAISFRFPREAGRWTVFIVLGQCLASLFSGGVGSALATLIVMMVLSLPVFITAVWLSRLGLRRRHDNGGAG